MKISERGKRFIKQKEGLRLAAYKDSAGVLTIGYGHTGADVTVGKTISAAEAEVLFEKDIISHEKPVQELSVKLNQNQYDALVSFAYNVGVGNFKGSTLYRKLKVNPDDASIATEFLRWTLSGGVVTDGLVTRRKEEAIMYFS